MKEKRQSQRRHAEMTETVPLRLVGSTAAFERRCLPDRRLNNLAVEEVDCMEYVFEIIKRDK